MRSPTVMNQMISLKVRETADEKVASRRRKLKVSVLSYSSQSAGQVLYCPPFKELFALDGKHANLSD